MSETCFTLCGSDCDEMSIYSLFSTQVLFDLYGNMTTTLFKEMDMHRNIIYTPKKVEGNIILVIFNSGPKGTAIIYFRKTGYSGSRCQFRYFEWNILYINNYLDYTDKSK